MTNKSFQMIVNDMETNLELIQKHSAYLTESKDYKNFNTRLAWDVYHGIVKTDTKHSIRKEDLNDSHIDTGLKKALKQLKVIQ